LWEEEKEESVMKRLGDGRKERGEYEEEDSTEEERKWAV
jgi:hypothetical protein